MHYTVLISADNGADQLHGYMYHAADLHLPFHTCKTNCYKYRFDYVNVHGNYSMMLKTSFTLIYTFSQTYESRGVLSKNQKFTLASLRVESTFRG